MEVWLKLKEVEIIVRKELKYNVLKPILISTIVFFIIFLFFGFTRISKDNMINIMEGFLPLIGIILITPIFEQEQDFGIEQIIRTRRANFAETLIFRTIVRVLIYIVITIIFAIILENGNSYMNYGKILPQSIGIGILYGGLGVFFFGTTFNLIIGYLIPILYFMGNMFLGYEKMKIFYLFRLKMDMDLQYGYYFLIGIILIIVGVIIRMKKSR